MHTFVAMLISTRAFCYLLKYILVYVYRLIVVMAHEYAYLMSFKLFSVSPGIGIQ